MPARLPGDAQSDEANRSGWYHNAASTASSNPAVCQRSGSGVNGRAHIWPANAVDEFGVANECLASGWPPSGAGPILDTTRCPSLADNGPSAVPQRGRHLHETPQPTSPGAEERVANPSLGVRDVVCLHIFLILQVVHFKIWS